MLFIYPMWDNESQRIGKQKCTLTGYMLHCIAEFLGFVGLLLLLGTGMGLVYKGIFHAFDMALLWLLAAPLGLGFISQALYQYSWRLALKKGFHYDYEKGEASWLEEGRRRTYKCAN
ncbi:MAG: hypothetical protein HY231_14390 [Acidobacteria bacterium]|nr:hypothetical protein [Acidobacteriota bacterium]